MSAPSRPSLLRIWLAELRLPFASASTVPVLLGASIAWGLHAVFSIELLVLTLVAGVCLHLGSNVANDYFDHLNKSDDMNVDYVRPFSGGARMIQEGLLRPKQVLAGAMILFAMGGAIGLYLAYVCGLVILILGAIGAFSGFFYTAPPLRLVSRGIGEVFIGLNFGVLMTLGSFYVQVRQILLEPIVASLPVAVLIVAVLYINQFPDSKADEAAGKRTSVVRLGLRNASRGYVLLLMFVYVIIWWAVLLGLLRWHTLIGLGTIPIALLGSRIALERYSDPKGLTPVYACTVLNHMITGFSLSVAYLLYGFVAWPFITLGAGLTVFALSTALAVKLGSPPPAPSTDVRPSTLL